MLLTSWVNAGLPVDSCSATMFLLNIAFPPAPNTAPFRSVHSAGPLTAEVPPIQNMAIAKQSAAGALTSGGGHSLLSGSATQPSLATVVVFHPRIVAR